MDAKKKKARISTLSKLWRRVEFCANFIAVVNGHHKIAEIKVFGKSFML
ncbi:hypothetical protein [Nostoc sp. CCY 9925]